MANSITLTDIAANRIFAGDRANASVPVAGTYTWGAGGNPVAIQAQVIEVGDLYTAADVYALSDVYAGPAGAVVVPWTTIVASPTGGTFSGSISVPIHSTMLLLQVRFSDTSSQANGNNPWGVGYLILAIGQSNMQNLWITTAMPAPMDSRGSYYVVNPNNPPGWYRPDTSGGQNNGDGMIAMVNRLCALLNAPVGIILGAVGGTALDAAAVNPIVPFTYWLHTGGVPANWPADYIYQACADAITNACQSDISAVIWMQGEQEINIGFNNYAQYQADLVTLYGRLLALCPQRTAANFLFHVGVVGFANYGSAVADGIRNAQIQQGLAGGGLQLGPCSYDLPMLQEASGTTQHHTAPGYVTLGRRWAMQVAYWMGTPGTFIATPGTSPRVTKATRQGKSILMTVQQPPGALFLGAISPSVNATGFSFSTDNFVTTLTPVLVRQADPGSADLTQITATFASDPGAQVQIKYQSGQPSSFFPALGDARFVYPTGIASLANTMYGGRNPASEPLGLPLAHLGANGIILTQDAAPFAGVPIFPTLLGLGWSVKRTDIWSTNLQENISGKQVGIGYWSSPKYQWELTYEFFRQGTINQISYTEQQQLMAFFNQLSGRLKTFLFLDPDDFQVTQQLIDVGDGVKTTFTIVRSLPGQGAGEPILAPDFDVVPASPPGVTVNPTAAVYLNGVITTTANYSKYGNAAGSAPGILTFNPAPASNVAITASFWYYWPCRFDDDKMTFEKFVSTLYKNGKVSFTSVKN